MADSNSYDYGNYSINELMQVHNDIDKEKYPDRFQEILAEIEKRKSQPTEKDLEELDKPHRPFFRRLGAFIIDIILIGIIGQVLSVVFSSQLISLGDRGPFIGLLVLFLYFGFGNSKAFNGQTVGKSVMKIAVKRIDGQNLPISISMLRSLIYIVPFIFNGWGLDLGKGLIISIFWALIGAWLFSYIISLLIFTIGNWSSGRLIQDLLFKTKVDRLEIEPKPTTKREKILFIISTILFIGLLGFFTLNTNNAETPEDLRPISKFHQNILNEFPGFKFGVNLNHVTGDNNLNMLTIRAFPKMPISDEKRESYIDSFALKAINDYEGIEDIDFLSIGVIEGFYIGIASRTKTNWERWPVGKWRRKLGIEGNLDQGVNKKVPFIPSLRR
jgi:uncharacterized RDD family membrane protein YckC